MEAPKKIYVHVKKNKVTNTWNSTWIGACDIEYIRKDVFIEKIEKYLTEKFIKDVSVLAGGVVSINFDSAINNFITYMKEQI